jgi:hypothetical protein
LEEQESGRIAASQVASFHSYLSCVLFSIVEKYQRRAFPGDYDSISSGETREDADFQRVLVLETRPGRGKAGNEKGTNIRKMSRDGV